ncbi:MULTISPECIES: TetR/AcrR family transcriptional regulator [unclassified Pseudomonas]|uniref:TetR/AcrR family transcriptional regulator n=1 Tax=Pseudomonas sp. MYb327 TaxID=2745230 RepID=A0AAU8DW52_9PSED
MSVKPKGRPRRELDEALLQAAADEFLEFGYTDANLGRIAEAGKTTKPALYRRFPSKELLFEAVLEHISRDFELDLSFLLVDRPVAQLLYELALLFYDKLGTPRVMAMSRLGAHESVRFPQLIINFREEVMSGFMAQLTGWLDQLNAKGVVQMSNTLDAAIIFLTLAGRTHERLMGVQLAQEQVEPHLREIVRFFLAGYAPRPR